MKIPAIPTNEGGAEFEDGRTHTRRVLLFLLSADGANSPLCSNMKSESQTLVIDSQKRNNQVNKFSSLRALRKHPFDAERF